MRLEHFRSVPFGVQKYNSKTLKSHTSLWRWSESLRPESRTSVVSEKVISAVERVIETRDSNIIILETKWCTQRTASFRQSRMNSQATSQLEKINTVSDRSVMSRPTSQSNDEKEATWKDDIEMPIKSQQQELSRP